MRQSGAAPRALLNLGATDVEVLRDGAEVRIPVQQLSVDDRFAVVLVKTGSVTTGRMELADVVPVEGVSLLTT